MRSIPELIYYTVNSIISSLTIKTLSRTRLFLIGVRSDILAFPQPPTPELFFKYVTIDDAIGDLVEINDESIPNQSQYFVATKATSKKGNTLSDRYRV